MSKSPFKYLKITEYFFGGIVAVPILYLLISIILSMIVQNEPTAGKETIYLSTNGVHADFIFPINSLKNNVLNTINIDSNTRHIALGWGDKNFYINTPEWSDLTFKNALSAAFLKSESLLHITRYSAKQPDWITVHLTQDQLDKLLKYVQETFKKDESEHFKILNGKGYGYNDDFYEANGSYTCLKTCNTWINSGLKASGLRCCFWTPFDFSILRLYRE